MQKNLLAKADSFCPNKTKGLIIENLKTSYPSSEDLTWKVVHSTIVSWNKNQYLGSLLAIDAKANRNRAL